MNILGLISQLIGIKTLRLTISIDFYFTAKQTPANDENVLWKIFYVETNGALNLHQNKQNCINEKTMN